MARHLAKMPARASGHRRGRSRRSNKQQTDNDVARCSGSDCGGHFKARWSRARCGRLRVAATGEGVCRRPDRGTRRKSTCGRRDCPRAQRGTSHNFVPQPHRLGGPRTGQGRAKPANGVSGPLMQHSRIVGLRDEVPARARAGTAQPGQNASTRSCDSKERTRLRDMV